MRMRVCGRGMAYWSEKAFSLQSGQHGGSVKK